MDRVRVVGEQREDGGGLLKALVEKRKTSTSQREELHAISTRIEKDEEGSRERIELKPLNQGKQAVMSLSHISDIPNNMNDRGLRKDHQWLCPRSSTN
ncbi:MAG: hypothetical protein P1V97_28580 [Planctomycetota bacterium]|nr:hypothetical protein [Planctomycetota bacterium]